MEPRSGLIVGDMGTCVSMSVRRVAEGLSLRVFRMGNPESRFGFLSLRHRFSTP